jgi:signal transduction histidine kinase
VDYTLTNLQDLLKRSRDGLKRIQQIVLDLRAFARLDESDLSQFDLNAGISSTMNIVSVRAREKDVRLELKPQTIPPVFCYPAKINQVIMNLVANAIDASPSGGTVTIQTGTCDDNVRIDVLDQGLGIKPEHRDRIFEPFFTTKPIGQGVGLGLSISYSIVQDHGGRIEVNSGDGQPTRFSVYLPVSRKPPLAPATQNGG